MAAPGARLVSVAVLLAYIKVWSVLRAESRMALGNCEPFGKLAIGVGP